MNIQGTDDEFDGKCLEPANILAPRPRVIREPPGVPTPAQQDSDRGTTTLVLFVIESLQIITPNDDFCMNDDFLNNDYVYFKKCQVRP